MPLQNSKHNRDRQQGQYGHCQDQVPLHHMLTLEGCQPDLEGEVLTAAQNDQWP